MIFTTLSSSSLIHCLYHAVFCWFLVLYFLFQLLYLPLLFFFVFSNSLLQTSNFSLCSSNLLLSSLNIFMIITLTTLLVRLLISASFSSSKFYLVTLFAKYFSVFSFCLICYFYFYVFVRLVMFPALEKWPCVGHILCVPAVHSLVVTGAIWSKGARFVGCMGSSVVVSWLLWLVW